MARNASLYMSWKQGQLTASVTNRVLLVLATLSLASCDFSGSSVDANYAAGVVLSKENSSIYIENRELVAGSSTKVTVFLRDQDFQPYISPNAQVELKLASGSDQGQLSELTDQGDGSYSASLRGLRVGDPISLQASVSDTGIAALVAGQMANSVSGATGWQLTGADQSLTVEPATVRILPGAVSRRKSTVTVSADQVISGSSITATFTAQDDFGNLLKKGGLSVSFSNSGGESTGVWGPTTDIGDGTYTAVFTGALGGTATTVSASMGSLALTRESSDPALPTVTVSGGQPFSIAVFSGSPQTGVVGTTLAPWTAVVRDSNNNPLPNITVRWALTSGGGSLSTAPSNTNNLGQASSTLTLGALVGVSEVTASVDGRPDLNAIFSATGVAGAVQSLVFSTPASGTGIAGTALTTQPVVTARDANQNVVPSYASPISFTGYSDAACSAAVSSSLSGNAITASSGTAAFTALTVLKTSIASLKASDGTRSTSCTTITMSAGAPFAIAISSGNNQSGTVGAALGQSLQVVVKDANDNAVPSTPITWAVTQGGGSVASASTSTNGSGIATNTWTLGTTAGTNTATAKVTSNQSLVATFTATGTAGSATQLAFTTSPPSTGTAGTALTTQPVVRARDANGNVVPSYASSITFTGYSDAACSTAVSSSLSGNAITASSGTATFTALTVLKTSVASLKASDGALSTDCVKITVSPGAPATITISSGNNQSGTAGSPLAGSLQVLVTDANSNIVPSTSITWAVIAGGGSVTSASTSTNVSGLASNTWTLGTTAGTNSATAKVTSNLSLGVTFNATGTAGSATQLAFTTSPSSTGTAGTALSTQPVVTARDANQNVVPSYASPITFTGYSDAACSTAVSPSLSGHVITASSGSATFTELTVLKTSVASLKASDGALSTDCVKITVSPGAPFAIAINSGNNQSGTVGSPLAGSLQVLVTDANSNIVPSTSITWAVIAGGGSLTSASTSTNGSGLATDTWTLGTIAGINTATAQVTNSALVATFTASGTPGSVTSLAFDPPVSSSNTAGSAFGTQPTVKLYDAYSNLVTTSSSPVVLSLSSGSGTLSGITTQNASGGVATFMGLSVNLVGSKKITATVGTVTGVSNLFTVSPGSPASITINAGNNQANAYVGSQLGTALQVLVTDSFGNVVPGFPVTWAVDQTKVIGALYAVPTSTTDSNGLASNLYTMGSSAGNNGIIASVGAFSASFVETGIALPSPTLSYSGSTGITGFVGTPMSISPTTLLPAGQISTCQVTSGSLPPGLSLNTSSCVISGTPTRDQSTQAVGVTASNSSGSGSASVSITVNCSANYVEFNYTGADQAFTPTCSQVSARMWGAGGSSPGSTTRAGAGGFVKGTLSLDLTKSYKIIVGQGPGVSSPAATYGGGGPGGVGAGGGRTAIQDTYGDILTAGGGGGTNSQYSCYGGGGGGLTGLAGAGGVGYSLAQGGSQTAGGAGGGDGGSGSNVIAGKGSQYQGGPGYTGWGGGGGGGYYGGGGGSTSSSGGGGGSSYYGGTVGVAVANGVSIAATTGATSTPGGSLDKHYKSGVGTTATNTKAGNGYAILYWGALARSVSVSGSTLTIIGFNLTADTAVTFSGGASCTGISLFDSGDRMTCTIPNGLVNQDVTITVPGYAGKVFSNVL